MLTLNCEMTTQTITNLHGQSERVSLPQPHWVPEWAGDGPQIATGVKLCALYSGPRTGRKYAHTHSIWQDRRTGSIVGEEYCELDPDTYLTYCQLAGCEVVEDAFDLYVGEGT